MIHELTGYAFLYYFIQYLLETLYGFFPNMTEYKHNHPVLLGYLLSCPIPEQK
jgi:hypothetical protein